MPGESQQHDAAVEIIKALQDAGHVAYLAGGCVRDRLLGLEPKDYDVATAARPEEVRKLFRKSRYVGESFGVVLVHLSSEPVEVATFRIEWGYEDGRRPSHVEFSDAEHDAQRRDFTINGLFEDPFGDSGEGEVIDYVEGRRDLLEHRVVRAIGDPKQRFAEDYLRMLRAPRFAAALGFDIDDATAAAIRAHAGKLGRISRERIGHEVLRMLTGPNPDVAANYMHQLSLDGPVLNAGWPEDCPLPLPDAQVDAGLLKRVGRCPDYPLALAAWMLDLELPGVFDALGPGESDQPLPLEVALDRLDRFCRKDARAAIAQWRTALNLSNEHRHALGALLSDTVKAMHWRELREADRKRLMAEPAWRWVLPLLNTMAGNPGVRQLLDDIEPAAQAYEDQGVAPAALVDGNDAIQLGMKPGPAVGRLLHAAYDAQLEGRFSDRQGAIAWLKSNLAQS